MATPEICVFDIPGAPRRPGLDDVGGGQKENDPNTNFVPDPVSMPTAEDDNQHQNLLVRYGGVIYMARASVHFTAGTPAITKAVSLVAAVVPGTYTVVDNGVGDTSITWPANTFPTAVVDHEAVVTGATGGFATCESITNGIRVRTFSTAGAAADRDFNFNVS